eukprot:8209483-Pyramimonas_sp.AAC.2
MAGFAHLEGGERGYAGCKRGSPRDSQPWPCVSYYTVGVRNGVPNQQNEVSHVPNIIAHMLGGVRLGGKGLVGLMGCRQGGLGGGELALQGLGWGLPNI